MITLASKDSWLGFRLVGEAPAVVSWVEGGSAAQAGGLRVGDYIIGVGSEDVRWEKAEQVQALIKVVEKVVRLKVITPLQRDSSKARIRFIKNSTLKFSYIIEIL